MSISNILPNGEIVNFDDEHHTYTIRGRVLPSITQLIEHVHGDSYKYVNPELLERAAAYGSKVHSEIQNLILTRDCDCDISGLLETATQETRNYFKFIEPIYHIKPLDLEKMVVLYDEHNEPIAAGRFDLLAENINHEKMLCDFKTTSSLSIKSVSDQLNLYKKAGEQSGYFKTGEIKSLAAIHLSGEQCKLRPVQMFGDGFFEKYIQAAKTILKEV